MCDGLRENAIERIGTARFELATPCSQRTFWCRRRSYESEQNRKNKPIRGVPVCSSVATCEGWCVPGASWRCGRWRCISTGFAPVRGSQIVLAEPDSWLLGGFGFVAHHPVSRCFCVKDVSFRLDVVMPPLVTTVLPLHTMSVVSGAACDRGHAGCRPQSAAGPDRQRPRADDPVDPCTRYTDHLNPVGVDNPPSPRRRRTR